MKRSTSRATSMSSTRVDNFCRQTSVEFRASTARRPRKNGQCPELADKAWLHRHLEASFRLLSPAVLQKNLCRTRLQKVTARSLSKRVIPFAKLSAFRKFLVIAELFDTLWRLSVN